MIGKGGHAEVYKGRLPDGKIVGVKKLVNEEMDDSDNTGDFLTELGIIAHINHPNCCRLYGFGIEKGLYFVLQFAPHGSLASLLFGLLHHPLLLPFPHSVHIVCFKERQCVSD